MWRWDMARNKKGMTLLEIIIGLGIFAMIVPIMFYFFMSHNKAIDETSVRSNLQFQGQLMREAMTQGFMEGKTVINIYDEHGGKIDFIDSEAPITKIQLKNYEDTEEEFYTEDNKLYHVKALGTKEEVGKFLESIKISKVEDKKLQINNIKSLNFTISLRDKDVTYDLTFNVYLRNKE